jgi:hypothetical protein
METWMKMPLTPTGSLVTYPDGSAIVPGLEDVFGSCQDLLMFAIVIFFPAFGPWVPFPVNSTSSLFSSFQYQHHKSLDSINRLDTFTTSTSPYLIAILQLH